MGRSAVSGRGLNVHAVVAQATPTTPLPTVSRGVVRRVPLTANTMPSFSRPSPPRSAHSPRTRVSRTTLTRAKLPAPYSGLSLAVTSLSVGPVGMHTAQPTPTLPHQRTGRSSPSCPSPPLAKSQGPRMLVHWGHHATRSPGSSKSSTQHECQIELLCPRGANSLAVSACSEKHALHAGLHWPTRTRSPPSALRE